MNEPRTAIVTGAGKRVGAHIAEALVERGWSVIAHVRRQDDPVPEGATRVTANLADPGCAQAIFAAADAHPPVRLLVNNAARFAWDGLADFSVPEFDAHMAINVRAPVLLTCEFARRLTGGDGLVVNILDSKLAAPNPDFLSYTLSKQALAGFTELAARALAPRRVRVNGIAPALMLKSAGQSDRNFAAMHACNPLGRGVIPADVVAALDYLLVCDAVTGQVLAIDGGQSFSPPARDVQFLEGE
ncbi:MAG: SDR family oxidoreductase [Pseudomonadota bacterium]|nr:SDR family oxidoreductase [Sphingomonas sp.]MDQ3471895.1 SDR family oxidoreductase [Pseudomonadota bacterium]